MRTSVPIAPNGGKDPEVIDAAACTFLHEGREADIRRSLHRGLLCGEKCAFTAGDPMSASQGIALNHNAKAP